MIFFLNKIKNYFIRMFFGMRSVIFVIWFYLLEGSIKINLG